MAQRGRPRKNPLPNKTPEQIEQEKPYTIENTIKRWNQLFTNGSYNPSTYLTAIQNAMSMNPYIANQRLKKIPSAPVFYDRDSIEDALGQPQYNEQILREASWALSSTVYPLYRIMRLYPDILTYKHMALPKYVSKSDMSTPRFKSDSKLVDMWQKTFKIEQSFRDIAMKVFREGKYAAVYRQKANTTTGYEKIDYALLQPLPSDWWKVTSVSENGFKASLNFCYFWTPGTSVTQFPDVFQDYYNELSNCSIKSENGTEYQINLNKAPTDAMIEYIGGNWYFWKELPQDLCFVFSSDTSHIWQVPNFISLFLPASDLSSYQLLQQQLTSIPLYSMVLAEIPLDDKSSSGSYTNDVRLSPELIDGFEARYAAKAPPGTSIYSAPFNNMQYIKYESVPNAEGIYMNAMEQFVGNSAAMGIVPMTSKPSIAQVKSSQSIETRYADILYGQFKSFANVILKEYLNLKYDWEFYIWGNVFDDSDTTTELFQGISGGITSLMPKYLAMHDLSLEDSSCASDYVDSFKFYDKFKALVSAFQASSKANGRPPEKNTDNDATGASQDSGTNTADGRTFVSELQDLNNDDVDEILENHQVIV